LGFGCGVEWGRGGGHDYWDATSYRVSWIWASYISLWLFGFRLEPIFTTAPAASENPIQFKRGQNQLENNHLALLIYIYDPLCRIFEILAFDFTAYTHKKLVWQTLMHLIWKLFSKPENRSWLSACPTNSSQSSIEVLKMFFFLIHILLMGYVHKWCQGLGGVILFCDLGERCGWNSPEMSFVRDHSNKTYTFFGTFPTPFPPCDFFENLSSLFQTARKFKIKNSESAF